jgi:hypothetical protein
MESKGSSKTEEEIGFGVGLMLQLRAGWSAVPAPSPKRGLLELHPTYSQPSVHYPYRP